MNPETENIGNEWRWKCFGLDEWKIRDEMTESVYGDVLEIGCGTGRSSAALLKRCRTLMATDYSKEMLDEACDYLSGIGRFSIKLCDVHSLPFLDNAYDCVFHFGALNTFKDIKIAISEMTRVVKTGGKVIIGDEGIAPWLRDNVYGRVLIKANPLYLNQPPVHLLPVHANDVTVRWIMGNAFYLIEYTKGSKPKLDMDLPIPGPRGGTLRSRYET